MSGKDAIEARLEEFKNDLRAEIIQLIQNSQKNGNVPENGDTRSLALEKYKPTKHKRAYTIERNYKKRCYYR